MSKIITYLIRWQMSSAILYPVLLLDIPTLPKVMLANLIGGVIFYFVDKQIFSSSEK